MQAEDGGFLDAIPACLCRHEPGELRNAGSPDRATRGVEYLLSSVKPDFGLGHRQQFGHMEYDTPINSLCGKAATAKESVTTDDPTTNQPTSDDDTHGDNVLTENLD